MKNGHTKVLVGNLVSETKEESISEMFHGMMETIISITLPLDARNGNSKGYAYVVMANPLAAAQAVDQFDGWELGGRRITVCLADPTEAKGAKKWYRFGM